MWLCGQFPQFTHDFGVAAVLVKNDEIDLMPDLLTLLSCF